MAHLADKAHFDRHTLARVNSAILLGLIGGGLLVCVFGAAIYDVEQAISAW
jgi:hypothetical protein